MVQKVKILGTNLDHLTLMALNWNPLSELRKIFIQFEDVLLHYGELVVWWTEWL